MKQRAGGLGIHLVQPIKICRTRALRSAAFLGRGTSLGGVAGASPAISFAFGTLFIITSRRILILVLISVCAFGASLGGSFHLDDYSLLSQDLLRPLEIRPLTYLTFWINHQLGGENPVGYHVMNLALHLVAVALLFHALGGLIPAWPALRAGDFCDSSLCGRAGQLHL